MNELQKTLDKLSATPGESAVKLTPGGLRPTFKVGCFKALFIVKQTFPSFSSTFIEGIAFFDTY
jgi:hypothetical protein